MIKTYVLIMIISNGTLANSQAGKASLVYEFSSHSQCEYVRVELAKQLKYQNEQVVAQGCFLK